MAEGSRVFNINGNYIEKQEIHVENGGVLNFGSPQEGSEKQQAREENSIPRELNTPKADGLWRCTFEHGWTDECGYLLISMNKGAILASVMSDILDLSPRWSAFETFWGIKDMPTKLCQAQECNYYANFLKEVEKAFATIS